MQTKRFIATTAAVAATIIIGAVTACSEDTAPTSKAALSYGPAVAFADGSARTWLQTDAAGAPSAIGIAMTEGALSGLPAAASGPSPTALMVSLALPAGASATGFDHAEIGWNPNGHEPQQLYGAPHFDVHFYTVPTATQMAILPSDPAFATKAANLPADAFVPAGYVPPPAPIAANAVPQMGVHWTDVKSPEFNGQPFTSTFIYGSWNGQFIFLEPMMTKAFLESHPSLTQALPLPAQWAGGGYVPASYSVTYDATTKEFRFTLGSLTKR